MFLAFVRRVKQVRSAGRGGIARPPFPTMAVLRPIEAQGSVALTESAELDEHVGPGSEGLDWLKKTAGDIKRRWLETGKKKKKVVNKAWYRSHTYPPPSRLT